MLFRGSEPNHRHKLFYDVDCSGSTTSVFSIFYMVYADNVQMLIELPVRATTPLRQFAVG